MTQMAFARAGLALALAVLVSAVGCRSTTDRLRVLEAEKAEAERQAQELRNQQAELRARLIEAQSKAESEEARRRAAEARAELLRHKQAEPAAPAPEEVTTVDVGRLRDRLQDSGVSVRADADGGATITLASDITFLPGRADLTQRAERVLQRVVRAIKEVEGIQELRIEGHTDSDPIRKSGWASNQELSLARAEVVRTYLASQGLSKSLMEVKGRGAEQPIDTNATPTGKARNRRVEIVLVTR